MFFDILFLAPYKFFMTITMANPATTPSAMPKMRLWASIIKEKMYGAITVSSITFHVHTNQQQRFLTHGTTTFKTVATVSHATESAMFGASAGTRWFESGVGFVIVYEVFHLLVLSGHPVDVVLIVHG